MNALNTIKTSINQKDIEKGQKILAAVYLVTSHLSDTEPIRQNLRSIVASFVCSSMLEAKDLVKKIEILLGGAVFAGLITEKNSSVIVYEVKHFYQSQISQDSNGDLHELFAEDNSFRQHHQTAVKDIKRTYSQGLIPSSQRPSSMLSDINKIEKNIINKDFRKDKILSFINDRKSAVIKDITSLFPEVSEKTIQRELNRLVESGQITKRGSKRWSVYMAVNSLL